MKVAYVINHYPKVSHSFIRREILALEDDGVEVVRIAIRGWRDDSVCDPDDKSEKARTTYVLREPAWRIAAAFLYSAWHFPLGLMAAIGDCFGMMRRSHRARAFHLAYLIEACMVSKWIVEAGAEHIHAHFGTNSAEVAMLAHDITGTPFSFTVHGPEEFDKPEYYGIARKIDRAAFVCAVSSFGRSQLYRWIPYSNWHKVKIVRCGLDEAFIADRAELPLSPNRFVCVGRICEQKGQVLLVDAAARLAARGKDFELIIAGDGEMRAAVDDVIAEKGLERKVRITGWIDGGEVAEQILSARALVLPSFAEGIPVVLMEALALRRPVITTYVAGIPELVQDCVSGWLIEAGDVNRLADAMEACLDAADERVRTMGETGRETVLGLHNISVEAKKLKSLIRTASLRSTARARDPHPVADVETT